MNRFAKNLIGAVFLASASISVSAFAEVPLKASLIPEILFMNSADEVAIKVSNVKSGDVVQVLWNGTDVSNYLKKLDKKGEFSVTDEGDGFIISFNDTAGLFKSGTFGLLLSNGSIISTVVASGDLPQAKTVIAQAGIVGFKVAGTVRYKTPNCWFFCWNNAPGATVKIVGDKPGFGQQQMNATTTTDSNGKYFTDKTSYQGCSGFTVTATYKGKSASKYNQKPFFCSGTYTSNIDIQ